MNSCFFYFILFHFRWIVSPCTSRLLVEMPKIPLKIRNTPQKGQRSCKGLDVEQAARTKIRPFRSGSHLGQPPLVMQGGMVRFHPR